MRPGRYTSVQRDDVKVLHINTWDFYGGAAQGMFILHKELLRQGIESLVLVQHQTIEDSTIKRFCNDEEALWRQGIDTLPIQFYPNKEIGLISSAIFDAPALLQKIQEINPDIVHMHWVFGGLLSLEDISRIEKPIIWTIRDFSPFTGGCHHPLGCDKYKSMCGECPILHSMDSMDITHQNLQRKRKFYAKNQISVVGISHWMSQKAKESSVFKEFDVMTIHNNIDTTIYYKTDKEKAKEILSLKTHKQIISIGAHNLMDMHKGLEFLLDALKLLDKEEFLVLLFGDLDTKLLDGIAQECISFGYVSDKNFLRNIYAASDVFVAPSLVEPFGKTVGESMACGTPVVCFASAGGAPELIEHKEDGYVVEKLESYDLAQGILWILENRVLKDISNKCANKIMNRFSAKEAASKYIELYKKKKAQVIVNTNSCIKSKNNFTLNLCKSTQIETMIERMKSLYLESCIVYGYGFMAQALEQVFPKKIKLFVDLDPEKIDNKKVFHPCTLKNMHFDIIVISVMRYEKQIEKYLVHELGVEKVKILSLISDTSKEAKWKKYSL